MPSTLKFWWNCASIAASGSSQFANDWQWVYGVPAVGVGAGAFAGLTSQDGTVMLLQHHPIINGILVAAVVFAVTWVFGLLIQMPVIAARKYHAQKDRAATLEEPLLARIKELSIQVDVVTATREQASAIREHTALLREFAGQGGNVTIDGGIGGVSLRAGDGGVGAGGSLYITAGNALALPNSNIPFQDAAQIAYESAEKNGWLDVVVGLSSDPADRLTTFKYMMLVQATEGAITLSGVRHPSRRPYPIPVEELKGLHPGKEQNTISEITSPNNGYHTVAISRSDLDKVVRTYHLYAQEHEAEAIRTNDFIPLNKAPEIVWKAIQGTEFAQKMEQDLRTPTKILNQLSNMIVGRGLAWGRKWPATERAQIEKTNLYYVMPDGVSLAYQSQHEAIILDVAVKPSAIDEFIRYAKNISGRI